MPEIFVIAYPWLKSLHLMSVILWMGAQFLLTSLLTVHRGLTPNSPEAVMLARIERQLIRRIMNPAMLATFVLGALLAWALTQPSGQLPLWLGVKLGFVFVLATLHGKLLRQFSRASEGYAQWSSGAYRLVQRFNFMLLAGVIALVVVRPLA